MGRRASDIVFEIMRNDTWYNAMDRKLGGRGVPGQVPEIDQEP